MTEQIKMHWWHMAFVGGLGATAYNDGYRSTPEHKLTRDDIEELMAYIGVKGAVVISCTYLGHMTKTEFAGDGEGLQMEEIVKISQETIDKANASTSGDTFEPFTGIEEGAIRATVSGENLAQDLSIFDELDEQERISEALARAQADEDREMGQGGLAGSAKADGDDDPDPDHVEQIFDHKC